MVLVLLYFLCNHDNLILKLHQKKIAALMKNSLPRKISKFIALCILNKEGE